MDQNSNLIQMPINFKKTIEYMLNLYIKSGVEISDGFQKDIIQNAIGATKTNKYNNWKCDIYLQKIQNINYLIIEDEGTVGLTGPNLDLNEINQKAFKNEILNDDWRLARFSSLHNSSETQNGPGLYGVGKIMYSAASKNHKYYFDSLTENGKYISNVVDNGQMKLKAYENQNAKDFILKETGFTPKLKTGTRIIITNPIEEIVQNINNGEINKYILESWWLLMKRMKDNAGIYVNHNKVNFPEINKYKHNYISDKTYEYKPGFKIKHFGLFINEYEKPLFKGISYYRKGMKICEIELKDIKIPETIKNNLWGYVQVDRKWEEELIRIEDQIHYGVSKGKKGSSQFQNLKDFVKNEVKKHLIKWGYLKENKFEDDNLKTELNKIAFDLQNLFVNLGYSNLGTGGEKNPFEIRLQNITFPKNNSIKVYENEKINFGIKVTNNTDNENTYECIIKTVKKDNKLQNIPYTNITIVVNQFSSKILNIDYTVSSKQAFEETENLILITINKKLGKKKISRVIPFSFNYDSEQTRRENIKLTLNSCIFPNKNSKRVNSNDFLTNIVYRIENNFNCLLNYKIKIYLFYKGNGLNELIEPIYEKNGIVNPFEEDYIDIEHIYFDKNILDQYLEKGVIELRAKLIANDDNLEYQKGDKITTYYFKINYNQDEKNGIENSFEITSVIESDDYRRSWLDTNGMKRTIVLNVGHTAYLAIKYDPDLQYEYCREQMLKQFVLIYLKEGEFQVFDLKADEINNLDPYCLVETFLNKVENTFYKSLES